MLRAVLEFAVLSSAVVALRADGERETQIAGGHASGEEFGVVFGDVVFFVLDDDVHGEGRRNFTHAAQIGERGALAVGDEKRTLAVDGAACGVEGFAELDELRNLGDLVEDVGPEFAIDDALDEVVIGQVVANVAEADGGEVDEEVEHKHRFPKLRTTADGEGGIIERETG